MARYKSYDYSQTKLIPVSFDAQILRGSFEHTLCYLVEHEVDLWAFASRYINDETGRPAYDPAVLLKIVLYAYSRGITSSREIERCWRENVVFMALSADTRPHFTTIAKFVSEMGEAAVDVYRDILLVCDERGLIGREMFAVDGLKLPSNASKEWSGTKAEFAKKVKKMEGAVRYLYRNGAHCESGGLKSTRFQGAKTVCGACELRERCLRHPERTPARQVAFFRGKTEKAKQSLSERMKRKIDSVEGRYRYGQRLGIVEPVFGNIRTTLALDRFSLRGKRKVNVQWMLYCLIHNIGKIHRYGAMAT